MPVQKRYSSLQREKQLKPIVSSLSRKREARGNRVSVRCDKVRGSTGNCWCLAKKRNRERELRCIVRVRSYCGQGRREIYTPPFPVPHPYILGLFPHDRQATSEGMRGRGTGSQFIPRFYPADVHCLACIKLHRTSRALPLPGLSLAGLDIDVSRRRRWASRARTKD